ncbi:MAG: hypothetical protein M0004_00670 [Actinomycetota bacterium]|nr:hypothetical protein [Actinomycetota bacterium]
MNHIRARLAAGVFLGIATALVSFVPASLAATSPSSTTAVALPPPAIPGVAPLPGPIAAPAKPASDMGILKVTPDQAVAGTPMHISGSHLAANASVELTWSSANNTWLVDPQPDSVNYLGRSSTPVTVVLAHATTNAAGAFSTTVRAPQDWGGVHDIYAVVNGVEHAHGGFIITRSVTISPRSGPVGTPITVTYRGIGASLYEGGASLLYDNHYVGEMMANWTRGVARVVIRASGTVGPHVIQVGDAISFLYLNLPQSPLPFAKGATATFEVTADTTLPAPSIDWPDEVAPTVSARTTLAPTGSAPASGAGLALSTTRGAVGASFQATVSGLAPGVPTQLVWSTVVGSRVNCKSVCWAFTSIPLATATPSGTSLSSTLTVPDGLGGWHVVQVEQDNKVLAQVPFYLQESLVGPGLSAITLKEGQAFTIHLKGVGWTQLDNTIAVDYDNSYLGYGCGFNSNGDVVLPLHATGGPGIHLIDIYPMIYTESPSFANTPYGMVPVLTYAQDEPALALGYHLPAIRLAIRIVG